MGHVIVLGLPADFFLSSTLSNALFGLAGERASPVFASSADEKASKCHVDDG